MRITNGMMINTSISNINSNKTYMDKLGTQIETTKKIQRPSDDPIAAIRALRLRSMESEIDQYLKKNVEDAQAWMEVTDGALVNLETLVTNITAYLNQGISEYQTVDDREKIITTLKQYREQLYQDGNTDNAERTIFTGFRTDDTLTFTDVSDEEYEIVENLNFNSIQRVDNVVGVDTESLGSYRESDVVNYANHTVMLAYQKLDSEAGLTISSENPVLDGALVQVRSVATQGQAAYELQDDEIVFIPESGELIFGNGYYTAMEKNDTFSVTYTKKGFEDGDLKPENYYYCTNKTKDITYGEVVEATGEKIAGDQQIQYNINFNQKITINVQGKDVLTADLGRDLDIIITAAEACVDAHNKVDVIEKKISAAETAGDKAEVSRLQSMLKAAELEVAYAEDNLTQSFKRGVTNYQGHQSNVATQRASIGSRMSRLELNRDRLESQSLTVEELKSSNEDTNLTEAAVLYKAASDVYDASLSIISQVVQKSLLDFL